jgi:hypothetical protein
MMLVTRPWVVVRVLLLFQFPPMKTFLIYVIDDILILNVISLGLIKNVIQ